MHPVPRYRFIVIGMTSKAISIGEVPAACTLPTAEQPLRLAELDELFRVVQRVERLTPRRLLLTLADSPGRKTAVQHLLAREAQCCSFFTFAVTDVDGLVLDVSVSPQQVDALDAVAQRASLISRTKR